MAIMEGTKTKTQMRIGMKLNNLKHQNQVE